MQTLRQVVAEYQKAGKGIGHFNVSDSNQLHAIAAAVRETKLPIIIGLSEGERAFFPLEEVRLLIDRFQAEGLPMYLNADHTYSFEKAAAAIDAGVDSIVVDGAKLPFDENVMLLKRVVAYAHSKDFFGFKKRVIVEGELGYIGQSSSVMDKLPEGVAITEEMMTKPDELKKLIDLTGIDMAAPAVGNVHGIVTSGQPKLSISHISRLKAAVGVPLVLHGGSGSSDEEFKEAVQAGMTIVHINTDIRVIYRDELIRAFEGGHDVAPYKFLAGVVEHTKDYVIQKQRLFAGQ